MFALRGKRKMWKEEMRTERLHARGVAARRVGTLRDLNAEQRYRHDFLSS